MKNTKELNQNEFKQLVLKDLGMVNGLTKSGKPKRYRYISIQCPECESSFDTRMDRAKGKLLLCASCSNSINSTKHGDSSTRLYRIWRAIKNRCFNIRAEKYKNYGYRGIQMCQEWQISFESFKTWSFENGYIEEFVKFKDSLSIDRIDNDGNYEPSNCQWITVSENSSKKKYDKIAKEKGLL